MQAAAQTLDFSNLSKGDPLSDLSLTSEYKAALETGGWVSVSSGTDCAWATTYKDDCFHQKVTTFRPPTGYTYSSYLVSPLLDLQQLKGKTLSFEWSASSVKGTISLQVLLIDAQGKTLATFGEINGVVGSNQNVYTSVSYTLPTLTASTGYLAFATSSTDGKNNRAMFNVRNIQTAAGGNTGEDTDPTEVEENVELLTDQYFYEFESNTPKKWQTKGDVRMLDANDCFNASTGNGIGLTTGSESGYLKQVVDLKGKSVKAGQELELLVHYFTEKSDRVDGPFRLAIRWLNDKDEEIVTGDSALLNNKSLFFGRHKAWGTLKFRAICPEGAAKLDFTVEVAPESNVRLDDFSALRLMESAKTPLTVILPQYLTIEGEEGVPSKHTVVVQTMHLDSTPTVKLAGGNSADTEMVLTPSDLKNNTTQQLTLTLTPQKKGAYIGGGLLSPYSASVPGADDENTGSLSIFAYIKAAGKTPTLTLAESVKEMKTEPNGTVDQMLTVNAADVISHVTLALEQPTGGPFRISTTQFYYSTRSDKLLSNIVKVTFAPRNAGDYTATLVISSPLADTLRVALHGVSVKATSTTLVERFSSKQTMDNRFTGDAWKNYNKFDRGYWKLDGTWNNANNVTLNTGDLYYDELLPNGVDSVKLLPVATAKQLVASYSVDGGGHWTSVAGADEQGRFAIDTHRPTLVRFTNKGATGLEVDSVLIYPADEAKRISYTKLEDAMLLSADTTALSLMNETFNGLRHTRLLGLKGWQNLVLRGARPFYAWQQKNDAGVTENDVAQISFYQWGVEDNTEKESWLISPTLSYKKAATKVLTFRLRYTLPTDNGTEQFGFYIISEKDKTVKLQYLDLDSLLPEGVTAEEGKWYDYSIDLSKVEGLDVDDLFHVAFSFYSAVGGSATSLTFMIDDVTFGRTDQPVIMVDKSMLSFTVQAGVEATPQTIKVTTEHATDPVTVTLVPATADYFKLSTTEIPVKGGALAVGFKSDDTKDHAAMLLLQTRGAAPVTVGLLAQNVASGISSVKADAGLVTASDGMLQFGKGVTGYAVYAADGRTLARGKAPAVLSLNTLTKGVLLVKVTTATGNKNVKIFNK